MNADAEYCGHPFCDRMVMSFQGGMYFMPAYSKTPGGLAASGVTTDESGSFEDEALGCFWRGLAAVVARAPGGSKKIPSLIKSIRSSELLKVRVLLM
jgi:hypothetical protein